MKASILFTLLIISTLASSAQDCDKCFKRRIALYDCNVQVPRPDDAAAIIDWWKLFRPSEIARSTIHNSNNPGNDCLQWFDGAMINADELQGDVLKFGQEYANLPPPGPIKSCEYLIESTVTGTEGNYVFTLILEAGPSREVVKTVEIPFEATSESAEAAGRKAAVQMMPLVETIKKFEVDKRNTDTEVAIGDYLGVSKSTLSGSITIKPSKTIVDVGEIIDVEITMTDCDGVPLPNRKIHFTEGEAKWGDALMVMDGTKGGEIIPGIATTNEAGKVTVKFKAGNKKGAAVIYGWYVHTKPYGVPYAFMGYSLVQIQVQIPNLWLLTAEFEEFYSEQIDTTISFSYGNMLDVKVQESLIKSEVKGKVIAIVQNQAEDLKNDFITDSGAGDPPFMMVSGTGQIDQYTKYWHTIGGKLVDAEIRNDNASGCARPGASFRIDYSGGEKSMEASMGIKAFGSYHIRTYGNQDGEFQWSDSYYDINNYSINAGDGCSMNDEKKVCILSKEGQGYSGVISIYEKKVHSLHKGYVKIDLVPYTEKSLSGQVAGKR